MESTDTVASILTLTAAGTGTFNGTPQLNPWGNGVNIGINTTIDAAGSYLINLQGCDLVSGIYYTIASTPAIVAAGFSLLTVYPGIGTTPATSVNATLPRTWRVQAVVTTGPITATVGASVIL